MDIGAGTVFMKKILFTNTIAFFCSCRSLCEQASGCIAKASREPSLSTAFALSEMEFELERCHVAFKKNLKKLLTICGKSILKIFNFSF